ncbi:MAG: hypothetical protein K0U41_06555 [Gammaproteobacteria bacterium]|nr:hypothetical protein [Gammaproteobacteria bacterium]
MLDDPISTTRAQRAFLTDNMSLQQVFIDRLRTIEKEVLEYGETITEYSSEDMKQIIAQLCRMFAIESADHTENTTMLISKYEEELKEAHDRIDKLQDKVYKFDLLTNRETPNE